MRSFFRPSRPALLSEPAVPAPAPASPAIPFGHGAGEPGWTPPGRGAGADPIAAKLPARAAAKYRQIIGEETDVNAVSAALDARRTALRDGRYTARRNLEGATSPRGRGGLPATSPHTVALLQKVVDDIDAEIAALDERQRALNQKRSRLPANLRVYLGSIVGPIAEHASPAELPAAPKSATWKDRVEIVRERLAVLAADLHAVESSPLPSSITKAQVRRQIAALAERGRPSVLAAIEIGSAVGFPAMPVQFQVGGSSGPGVAMGSIHDAVALLCWLDRERIISALEAEIDELADDEHALSPADRAKKESALLDQILESERVEEALIEAAEAEGASVQRRDNADPRAVLGLASSLPAPAAARR